MEKQNRKISANRVLIFKQRHGYHFLCLNLIEFNKRFEEGYVNIYSIWGNMWGRLWGNCRGKTVGKLWGYLWRKTAERNCGGNCEETAGGTAGGTAGETVGKLLGGGNCELQDGIKKGNTTERLFYNGRRKVLRHFANGTFANREQYFLDT